MILPSCSLGQSKIAAVRGSHRVGRFLKVPGDTFRGGSVLNSCEELLLDWELIVESGQGCRKALFSFLSRLDI